MESKTILDPWESLRVTNIVLTLGVLVELFLVFLVFLVEVLIELDKLLLVTCVVEVVCLPQQRFTEDGTERSTKPNDNKQLLLVLLQPQSQVLCKHVDTK